MAARTKIIATLGPASSSQEMIARLVEAGARIFRLNFSHGDAESFREIVRLIRAEEEALGHPLTIMQDLAGPKIRIGSLAESLNFARGDTAYLGPDRPGGNVKPIPHIPFDHPEALSSMAVGDRLVLADGTLQFKILSREAGNIFVIEAGNSGMVTSRKGLALPDKALPLPALTNIDKKNLRDGLALGVDAVALSFVQTARDVLEAKEIISAAGSHIPVAAKLERRAAVNNLEEILAVADIIMVARGDLGVECPLPALPAMQKRIISACNAAAKPVIVATQMLLSMVGNPAPTRAETTDVANAVLDGADCVMLSEETAMGAFPVETVCYMREIAEQAEELLEERKQQNALPLRTGGTVTDFLAASACRLADKIEADALVCYSVSGRSAHTIASHRPRQMLHAISPYSSTLHALNFGWGISPCRVSQIGKDGRELSGHLELAEYFVDNCPLFAPGARVVITAGQKRSGISQEGPRETAGTNLIKVFVK